MTKFKLLFLLVGGAVVVLVLDIFVAPNVSARLATLPLVRSFQVFSPEAPIVITKREVVRASDSTDIIDSVAAVKSKVVGIVRLDARVPHVVATGVAVTSNGLVVTSGVIPFAERLSDYRAVFDDGVVGMITRAITDEASGLALLVTDRQNTPIVEFLDGQTLEVGERVMAVQHGMLANTPRGSFGIVRQRVTDTSEQIFNADTPVGFLPISISDPLMPGSIIVNSAKEVVGIWNGNRPVNAQMVRSAITLFAADQQEIARPSFGFAYRVVTPLEAQFTGQLAGAVVTTVVPGSPAAGAKLKVGDTITSINGVEVAIEQAMESVLLKIQPGADVVLSTRRGAADLEIRFVAGKL